jgi:pimeloyl-ACP methyl ester carboxylesterase
MAADLGRKQRHTVLRDVPLSMMNSEPESKASKWLDIRGQRMHVIDVGPGDTARGTLLMVHGNPTWSFYFRRLIAHFSKHYRCIVPDHIGMGLSSKPDDDAYPFTLGQRIADLDNVIEQLCPHGPLNLVLHDWGGMIGMGYAVRHRARIARLALMNTAAFGLPAGKALPWSLRLCRTPLLGALAVRGLNLFCRGALSECMTTAQMSKADHAKLIAPYDSWANRIAVHRFVEDIPLHPRDPSYACAKLIERDLSKFIDCPTQIFWGGKDFVFDDGFLAKWQTILPQAEVHRFAEAGHYVLEDAHENIIPLLETFLDAEQ